MAEINKKEKNKITKFNKTKEESKFENSTIKKINLQNFFKVEEFTKNKKRPKENSDSKDGRWSKEEQNYFLEGLEKYGIKWRKVKTLISTRTIVQVRSYAQKFFQRMKICKDEKIGIDFTLDSICSIKDMINQIRSVNSLYRIKNVFLYLSDKYDNKRFKKNIFKIDNRLTHEFEKGDNKNIYKNDKYINDNLVKEKKEQKTKFF